MTKVVTIFDYPNIGGYWIFPDIGKISDEYLLSPISDIITDYYYDDTVTVAKLIIEAYQGNIEFFKSTRGKRIMSIIKREDIKITLSKCAHYGKHKELGLLLDSNVKDVKYLEHKTLNLEYDIDRLKYYHWGNRDTSNDDSVRYMAEAQALLLEIYKDHRNDAHVVYRLNKIFFWCYAHHPYNIFILLPYIRKTYITEDIPNGKGVHDGCVRDEIFGGERKGRRYYTYRLICWYLGLSVNQYCDIHDVEYVENGYCYDCKDVLQYCVRE
ncbi:MAG: hypothetical protein Solumvirus2_13 [Solumvirus sp.]|uniref:Uncharacterized protein n=1 Tax=Solumvirus sp. TaxID=2487773 RepID=A0A3G5AG60_9VIRU|nr:MAG: hypothetical protein Solumvirus2_13 [Solumvirus sp.]